MLAPTQDARMPEQRTTGTDADEPLLADDDRYGAGATEADSGAVHPDPETRTDTRAADDLRAGSEPAATGSGTAADTGSSAADTGSTADTGGSLATDDTSATGDRAPLVPADRAESYATRWNEVKGMFVDEPRQAVQRADGLVGELLDDLQRGFTEQRHDIEQGLTNDDTSTEDLRMALRRYRSFFDRLLSV